MPGSSGLGLHALLLGMLKQEDGRFKAEAARAT